ncbi:hypothetical protein [Arvimicrobium flavum]|uniref:hypothetical protein n=1 Tax=Arvimicrobium flavum TaxID=3393320 RepID=UPI00398D115D
MLRYRVGAAGAPATRDLAAAVSWIIRHADELDVDPVGYSLWGSSAGARMAASLAPMVCQFRRRQRVATFDRGHGLNGPFRHLDPGAAYLRCRRRAGWHRTSRCHGAPSGRAQASGHASRVSRLPGKGMAISLCR